jgi:hypothetical protein
VVTLRIMKINTITAFGVAAVIGIAGLVAATPREPVDPPVAHAEAVAPAPTPTAKVSTSVAATEARDVAAGILQSWDASFQSPPIVFYDDHLTVSGETFDPDTAAWYDGKIYIDPDTFDDGNKNNTNVHYTIGHEIGHGWEEHYDPHYPVGKKSELYADCMAGAIGAAAGWDVHAMKVYTYGLEADELHGDGEDRYNAMTAGETGGPRSCDLDH